MSPRSVLSCAFACVLAASLASAKAPAASAANPASAGSKMMFQLVSGYMSRSADKVDEAVYAFKPTPEVRSFGQIIGHVAPGRSPTPSSISPFDRPLTLLTLDC